MDYQEIGNLANKTTAKRPLPPQCWKPGQSGNPKGRAKGTRDKAVEVRELFFSVAEKQGAAGLDKLAKKDPASFWRIVASLIPKDLRIEKTLKLELLGDDELNNRMSALFARALTARASLPSPEGQPERYAERYPLSDDEAQTRMDDGSGFVDSDGEWIIQLVNGGVILLQAGPVYRLFMADLHGRPLSAALWFWSLAAFGAAFVLSSLAIVLPLRFGERRLDRMHL